MRIIFIFLFSISTITCATSKYHCNCFRKNIVQSDRIYLNEYDSIFQNNYHVLNFSKSINDGSESQTLFLEINFRTKDVVIHSEKKITNQSLLFKKYAINLLKGLDTKSGSDDKMIIPIIIHKINRRLEKVLDGKDCKFYHRRLKKFKKMNIPISSEICFASSGMLS